MVGASRLDMDSLVQQKLASNPNTRRLQSSGSGYYFIKAFGGDSSGKYASAASVIEVSDGSLVAAGQAYGFGFNSS